MWYLSLRSYRVSLFASGLLSSGRIKTAIDGPPAHPECLRYLMDGHLPLGVQPPYQPELLGGHYARATTNSAAGARRGKARLGALTGQVALELGERREDVNTNRPLAFVVSIGSFKLRNPILRK